MLLPKNLSCLQTRLDDLVMGILDIPSRKEATSFILRGMIFVDGTPRTKPGVRFPVNSSLSLKKNSSKFVSRAGEKLEHALQVFSLDIKNHICIDIGSSTGGFTHCLLSSGVDSIYAIDCGKNLLHSEIRNNPKVTSLEGVNARYLEGIPLPLNINLITIDVSFISVKKILSEVLRLFPPGYLIICLFKTHFEAPPQYLKRGGILPEEFHLPVLTDFLHFLQNEKICISNFCISPLLGKKSKNQEYFLLLDTNKSFNDSVITSEKDLQKFLS